MLDFMITLRCTHKLLKLSKTKPQKEAPPILPKRPLLEWYVNVISLTFPGKSAVIYSHAPSRLTVITVGRSLKKTFPQFRLRALDLLSRIGADDAFIQMQQSAFEEHIICKTESRSMLASMNEITYLIQYNASSVDTLERLDVSNLEDYLSTHLFGSKEVGKDYFTPAEYLKGHQFVSLN